MKGHWSGSIAFLLPLAVSVFAIAQYTIITPTEDLTVGLKLGYFIGGGAMFMFYLIAGLTGGLYPRPAIPGTMEGFNSILWSFQYGSVIAFLGMAMALVLMRSIDAYLPFVSALALFIQVKMLGTGHNVGKLLLLGVSIGAAYMIPAACVVWWQ